MKKAYCNGVLTAALLSFNGCASYATNRYLVAGNPVRLQATQDGAQIGIDLFSLRTVAEHPWQTLGAAMMDAGSLVGVYALGEKNGWWGGSSADQSGPQSPVPAQAGVVNIFGDGNTVHIGGAE